MSNIHLLPPLSVVSGSSDIKLWRKIKFVGDWIPPRPPQCRDWLDWLLLRWCWWRHWYSCWYLRWWGWRSWRWRWSLKIFFCVCFCWREKWCWCFRARACSWRWSRWGLWRGLWDVRSRGDWDWWCWWRWWPRLWKHDIGKLTEKLSVSVCDSAISVHSNSLVSQSHLLLLFVLLPPFNKFNHSISIDKVQPCLCNPLIQPPTHLATHLNLTLLFLSSLWSDLSMWGHFLIVLNLRNPNLISVCATERGNAH